MNTYADPNVWIADFGMWRYWHTDDQYQLWFDTIAGIYRLYHRLPRSGKAQGSRLVHIGQSANPNDLTIMVRECKGTKE